MHCPPDVTISPDCLIKWNTLFSQKSPDVTIKSQMRLLVKQWDTIQNIISPNMTGRSQMRFLIKWCDILWSQQGLPPTPSRLSITKRHPDYALNQIGRRINSKSQEKTHCKSKIATSARNGHDLSTKPTPICYSSRATIDATLTSTALATPFQYNIRCKTGSGKGRVSGT